MTDTITGAINNGSVGEATIGGYTGPVGISRQDGSSTLQLAFRDQGELLEGAVVVSVAARRSQRQRPLAIDLPIAGLLDGSPILVRAIKRSDLDQQMLIATAEPVE